MNINTIFSAKKFHEKKIYSGSALVERWRFFPSGLSYAKISPGNRTKHTKPNWIESTSTTLNRPWTATWVFGKQMKVEQDTTPFCIIFPSKESPNGVKLEKSQQTTHFTKGYIILHTIRFGFHKQKFLYQSPEGPSVSNVSRDLCEVHMP